MGTEPQALKRPKPAKIGRYISEKIRQFIRVCLLKSVVEKLNFMLRSLLTSLLLLVSSICTAHTCLPGLTLDKQFNESKRVFLVYVVETRLEEELQKKIFEKEHGADPESVKLVSAGYRIIEDYKGEKSYKPRLLDLLGIGTGYVGLTPGVYYLVFLGDVQDYETPEMRSVDTCTVPLTHYRLNIPQFQQSLDEVRALAKTKS